MSTRFLGLMAAAFVLVTNSARADLVVPEHQQAQNQNPHTITTTNRELAERTGIQYVEAPQGQTEGTDVPGDDPAADVIDEVVHPANAAAHQAAAEHAAHGTEAHVAGHEAHGEHGTHAIVWNIPKLIASLVNFLLWGLAIVWMMKKPMQAFLLKRREDVVQGLEEAQRLKAEAAAKHAEYEAKMQTLESEITRLRSEMKEAGMVERDRIVMEASKRGERMRADARFLVEQQMKTLREDMLREAVDAAVLAAEKALTERASADDQKRLADQYLSTLRTSLETKSKSTENKTFTETHA